MLTTTLSGNYGFPLCISGIAQHLSFSKEMDHDKRRKVMTRRRRSDESRSHGEEEMVGVERLDELLLLQETEHVRDLVALLQDLESWSFSSHIAKAA